jgi:SAM-dependent methyltransferase
MVLRRALEHHLTRGLDLDDPRTTAARREVLAGKPMLRAVYEEWYAALAAAVPPPPGRVLELGAGAGFLDRFLPGALRSEVFWCPWTDLALDGQALPFADGALRAVVMTNVLHHLPEPSRFLSSAAAAVRPGGVIAMVEPWNTAWSRFVYRRLHHEPFEPGASGWSGPGGGPLSGANGALPWILFARDRERLLAQHPEWELRRCEPLMPLRYLVAGGMSLRSVAPAASAPLWRGIERALRPWRHRLGMFAVVVLARRG